jgi:elongation factor Ts
MLRSAIRGSIGRHGLLCHASKQPAVLTALGGSRSSSSSSRSALIKELRAITSAPMKECVKALKAADDDLEAAITILRKSGMAAAAKKAGRGATEGAACIAYTPDGAACVLELNSETDFVARNAIFQELALGVARSALGLDAPTTAASAELDITSVSQASLDGKSMADADVASATSVTEALGIAVSKLGENIVLRRACLLTPPAAGGLVCGYVHNTYAPDVGKTAAAVVLQSAATDVEALRSLGQKLAMHVVAASPLFLDRTSVDAAALERERAILVEQATESGKPAPVVEKMVEGRLKKYYGEVCLVEQTYMIEPDAGSVAKVLAAAGEELGAEVSIAGFVRYAVGEGLEATAEA